MRNLLAAATLCACTLAWASCNAQSTAQATTVNLALNKPVTVSGDTQGEMLPAKAVDGVPGNESGWHSGQSPAWLQIDLEKTRPIDRVKVYLFSDASRYYQYTVEVSTDAKVWTKVVDMSTNTTPSAADGDDHRFAAVHARYVRVNLLKNSANPGVHLNEVMVFEASSSASPLDLKGATYIDLGEKPSTMTFADSSASKWDTAKALMILNYKPGKDKVFFGTSAKGLNDQQLARVGFVNPAGEKPGLMFTAKMLADGQVAPGPRIKPAPLPFDISDAARAQRARIYEINGLADLTGKGSPLKDGMTIVFYGDSITWLNGYIATMDAAIKKGDGTSDKKVRLVNRGLNGDGVLQLRDGVEGVAYLDNSKQAPFANMIVSDKADVAVIYTGINDVWWRKTSPEVFEKALRDIVATAKAHKTTLVLATMSVNGELPDGKNTSDPKIEQFSEITRKVAADTNTTLVDLRKAYIAYEQNNNVRFGVDGTLQSAASGLLTYDGVHPSNNGVQMLSNLIGEGIFQALKAGK